MTTTKFDRFREAYLEYISEYNKYKDLLQFSQLIEDVGYTQELTETATKKLSQKIESSGLLAQILIAQMHDTFIVGKEKSAYLLSIKTFVSRELDKWSLREPKEIKYKWQELVKSDKIYREWMPDYLYDIYFEVKDIESDNEPKPIKVPENFYTDFDKLFEPPYNTPQIIDKYINILREVDPPLINENNAYIGHYKTGFGIWIKHLKGIIVSVPETTYARLLNLKFSGLDIGKDAGVIRKPDRGSTYEKYNKDIMAIVSKLKKELPKPPKMT